MERKNNVKQILRLSLILIIITGITALLLAGVNALTADRIAENERIATEQSLASIFGEAKYTDITPSDTSGIGPDVKTIYETDSGDFGVLVSPQGFKQEIQMAVGISANGEIIGVSIISSQETSGIGSKAANDEYVKRYEGLSGELTLGTDVDGVSGATISSKAILKGINEALAIDFQAVKGAAK